MTIFVCNYETGRVLYHFKTMSIVLGGVYKGGFY